MELEGIPKDVTSAAKLTKSRFKFIKQGHKNDIALGNIRFKSWLRGI